MTHRNNFDFLRFLFAFAVVVGHTIGLALDKLKWLEPFVDNAVAVQGFFIISGYLVTNSWLRIPPPASLKNTSENERGGYYLAI